jgi:transcriptional regulator with XRE-family HTH domain
MDIEYLKRIKKQKKLTLHEISIMSGIPKRTVDDIFSGQTQNPRIDTLQAIERALGIEKESSPAQNELSEGEQYLIELFNRVPANKQEMVLQMIRAALEHL